MKNIYLTISHFIFLAFFVTQVEGQPILEIKKNDFFIGDIEAPITIIEYSSLSCGHCASFHNDTLDDIKKDYVDTGIVRFVFRDFPFNYPALLGSMVLKCIPSGVRYDYMNALFKMQKQWVVRDNATTTKELFKIMQSGGMTKEDFDLCIKDTELENEILQGVIEAQNAFNIKSTPSFLINGALIEGNKPAKEFRQIIDKILSK